MFKLLTHSRNIRARPNVSSRVDWGNPVTRGLVAYWPIAVSFAGAGVDYVNRFRNAFTTFTQTYGNDGYIIPDNGSINAGVTVNRAQNLALLNNGGCTWMFSFRYNGAGSGGIWTKTDGTDVTGWDIDYLSASDTVRVRFSAANTDLSCRNTKAFVAGVYYHVIITYDGVSTNGAGFKFYINGFLDTTTNLATLSGSQGADGKDILIGHSGINNTQFQGGVANFALWNRPLSDTEAIRLTSNPWSLLDNVNTLPLPGKSGATPLTITKSDSFTLSDTHTRFAQCRITKTDGLTILEQVFIPSTNVSLNLNEQLIFTDTLANMLGKGYQNFDIINLIDTPTLFSPYFFTKGETISLSDVAVVYPVISRAFNGDQLVLSDVLATLIRGVYKFALSDRITVTDVLALTLKNFVALIADFSENILLTDAFIIKLKSALGVFSDTLTISDLIKILMVGNLAKSDVVALNERVTLAAPENDDFEEIFNIYDTPNFIVGIVLHFAETLQFTDVVSTVIKGGRIQLQFSDGIVITDDFNIIAKTVITSYLRQYLNDVIN